MPPPSPQDGQRYVDGVFEGALRRFDNVGIRRKVAGNFPTDELDQIVG